MRKLWMVVLIVLLMAGVTAQAQQPDTHFVEHNGQQLFLSGINLAWIDFARDLKSFNEPAFVAALDEIAAAKGNTLRWWLHTDGSSSPVYGDDGMVSGLGENDIENFRRGVDLAYERGILIMPALWSHDMLKEKEGVPAEWNKLMIEDPAYTQAYIDNALVPLVTALKGHPGIVAWEIFNEPEGVTQEYGWTEYRTEMKYIQQFVNLLAGAIHRADPDVKVTNGSWNLQVLTDIEGMTNYYTDERLIAAGGDADGTLDFYQVHYYPEYFDETTSPFHNPYSHWELDKPLVIGEFPAKAIADLGMGFKPKKQLRNSMETYEYLYENGYAGALAWTFYASDFGKMLDATPGMLRLNNIAPEHIKLDIGEVDHIPTIEQPIENLIVNNDQTALDAYVNLNDVFQDVEDGGSLAFEITKNTKPEVVEAAVADDGALNLTFAGTIGTSSLEVTATDSAGHYARVQFQVQMIDPNRGNVALGKTAASSTIENEGYLPEYAVDGVDSTRWSTAYEDNQWFDVDLGAVYTVSQVILRWETAFGAAYDIQVWDGQAWQTVYSEPAGDGQVDDITLEAPVDVRYVRLNAITRGTQWGFSLWEFEVYGVTAEGADAALETPPPAAGAAAAGETAAPEVVASELLFGFEAGDAGWTLADYWAGGKGVEFSADMASEGSQALKLTGTFSGTAWEEMGAYIDPAEPLDLSAWTALSVDVYAPEGAENFLVQIFVKTGEGWTWANTADMAPTAGEWTTLTAKLETLGAINDVREIGVKVGTSTTALEGAFYVDNLTLIQTAAEPAPVEEAPAGPMLEKSMLLYSFESGAGDWVFADYWTAGRELVQSDEMASMGGYALKLTGEFSGTAWEEMGVYVDPPDGRDWSGWDTLTVDVYAPEGADGFLAQIFMKTGDDWTWVNTPDFQLVAGEWNTLSADLASMGDSAAVKEIGVKIGTGATAFSGAFFVDGVRLGGKEPAPAPQPMALYSFEDGQGAWVFAEYWTAGRELAVTDEMATDGAAALSLTGEFSGTTWEEMGVYVDPPDGADWSMYDVVTVDMYVPEGADGFLAQIFMKTGDDWAWVNTPDIQLVPGQWNTLSADLANMGDPAAVKEIGVKVGTSMTAFSGAFLVDNVMVAKKN